MFDIRQELKNLPDSPGVYIMHDGRDEVIYIGKAVNLKNRVRQYFQKNSKSLKIEQMVERIARFEYIVTDSELEALILECNLIKEYRPKYNTMLTDDKTYPYIKITENEEFPRIIFTRRLQKDKCAYYGPYTSAGAVKDTIELLKKLYGIRGCKKKLPGDTEKNRPCLNYHIGQCSCPCCGMISKEEYGKRIDLAKKFLGGDHESVIEELKKKMDEASAATEYEEAARLRDLIESASHVAGRQKMTTNRDEDRDIIGIAADGNEAVVMVFFVRAGKLIGREHFYLRTHPGESAGEMLESFINQYYEESPSMPREILTACGIEDARLIEERLFKLHGVRTKIFAPKKGEKAKLCGLASKNAGLLLAKDREKYKREEAATTGAVKELEEIIGICGVKRIESYDISNTSGFLSVGSMVVYEDGKPKKNSYRKFRIRTVNGPDDYESLREVLTRRFAHGFEERKTGGQDMESFSRFPDLILMDGGKGQVNAALDVLAEFNLAIPVCGMVKDDRHRTRGLYFNNEELEIDASSQAFRLITRIQDETHRFAIEYHRSLRSKAQVHSVLDEISGIGPTRRKALLRELGSAEAVAGADIETLKGVSSMNESAARAVYKFFHGADEAGEVAEDF